MDSAAHSFTVVDAAGFDALIDPGDDTLVVAYCWGPQCPNCEVFAADAPSLLAQLPEGPLRLLKVDVYEHPEVATRFGLYGIPAFLFFRRGKLLGKMSRYRTRAYWLAVVREQMGAALSS